MAAYDDPQEATVALVVEAYRLWLQYETRTDDITAIVIQARPRLQRQRVCKPVPRSGCRPATNVRGSRRELPSDHAAGVVCITTPPLCGLCTMLSHLADACLRCLSSGACQCFTAAGSKYCVYLALCGSAPVMQSTKVYLIFPIHVSYLRC